MKKIIKIFFVFSALLLLFTSKSYTEVIKKVNINGNERITKQTIIVYGDIKIGSDYQSSDVNLLIKKLYDTKFFSDISVELKDGVLNISIKENPIVNTVVFKGEEAKKFKESLASLLSIREKGSFIQSNLKSDINLIKEFYRNLGFYFIKIDASIEKLDKNKVNLIYDIDKGERAKIAKIFF